MKLLFAIGLAATFCVLTGAIVVYPDGTVSFAPMIDFFESVFPGGFDIG